MIKMPVASGNISYKLYTYDYIRTRKGEFMKKLLVLLVLVLIPLMSFADLQLGPTAFYNMLITNPGKIDTSKLSISDFTFGADARLNLGIIQGSAYALLTPGDTSPTHLTPTVVNLMLDIGICLDILFVRLSAGIGPDFMLNFADYAGKPQVFEMGANAKIGAELMLGGISLGLTYFVDVNLTEPSSVVSAFSQWNGHLGLSVLLKLL
jgi:hypothetical protein